MSGVKGKSGRKPKPPAILKLTGQYREDRHGGGMIAPNGRPQPPEWLTYSQAFYFSRAVNALENIPELLSPIDADALALYAVAWDQIVTIEDQLQDLPPEERYSSRNPAITRRNEAMHTVMQLMQRFGLSPGDRAGLKIGLNQKQDDPFTQFMRKQLN